MTKPDEICSVGASFNLPVAALFSGMYFQEAPCKHSLIHKYLKGLVPYATCSPKADDPLPDDGT